MNKKPNFIKAIIFGAVAFVLMTLFWKFFGKPDQHPIRLLSLGLDHSQKNNVPWVSLSLAFIGGFSNEIKGAFIAWHRAPNSGAALILNR